MSTDPLLAELLDVATRAAAAAVQLVHHDRPEQLEVETANFAGERHDLVAQLEAERAIHEALRQDMTGRIEAASSGRGRARSAV